MPIYLFVFVLFILDIWTIQTFYPCISYSLSFSNSVFSIIVYHKCWVYGVISVHQYDWGSFVKRNCLGLVNLSLLVFILPPILLAIVIEYNNHVLVNTMLIFLFLHSLTSLCWLSWFVFAANMRTKYQIISLFFIASNYHITSTQ